MPFVRVECQMRSSGSVHPEGCCRRKSKVVSLSGHPHARDRHDNIYKTGICLSGVTQTTVEYYFLRILFFSLVGEESFVQKSSLLS